MTVALTDCAKPCSHFEKLRKFSQPFAVALESTRAGLHGEKRLRVLKKEVNVYTLSSSTHYRPKLQTAQTTHQPWTAA